MNQEGAKKCKLCEEALPAAASGRFCTRCVFLRMLDGTNAEFGKADSPSCTERRKFEDYEILEEISRSASAVVFKAREVSLDRIVALKVLPRGWGIAAEEMARVEAEAAVIARLDHSNILPIYDFGELALQPYLSMRFVVGASLAGRIGEFFGRPKRIGMLMEKIARAIQFAHEQGVLHLRLEPGNVLVGPEGEPFVTDFHAPEFGPGSLLAADAAVAHLAPEQVREESVDERTDVYSLGSVLFQLLTGEPPFAGGSTYDTLKAVVENSPRPLTPTDEGLAAISLKCLSKQRDRRYASAAQMADDLVNWRSGRPVVASGEALVSDTGGWMSRPWFGVSAIAAAGALVAAVMLLIWV